MDSAEDTCPVCGQPAETVVRRHKTLGAWVPVWGHGPCRNPECAAYREPDSGTRPRERAPRFPERGTAAAAKRGGTSPDRT
ncbi:hypothetical protein ACL02U_11245 [Streptomyces sp. MS06]|uniref:hypothetical protein n=1 Tax=Streptomyces sp. MS06 TaxID=3385974 RepID=UPI0039A3AFD4